MSSALGPTPQIPRDPTSYFASWFVMATSARIRSPYDRRFATRVNVTLLGPAKQRKQSLEALAKRVKVGGVGDSVAESKMAAAVLQLRSC
ncbi:hypothetical protein L917_19359 [Phytophthora nicotianae]|nr:hypothetical protein L917_19359 [Phytophthora nicotianae]